MSTFYKAEIMDHLDEALHAEGLIDINGSITPEGIQELNREEALRVIENL
jgi:hypothetical protein